MFKVAQRRRWQLLPSAVSEYRWVCLNCQRRLQHSAAAELPLDPEETQVRNTNFPPQRGRATMHPPRAPRTYISRPENGVSRKRYTPPQLEFQRTPRAQPRVLNRISFDSTVREPPMMDKRDVDRVAEVRPRLDNSNK
jgi:hypothetical protein